MGMGPVGVDQIVDEVYRSESRRVLATLIHLLGDFDRAEEAMHDAFAAAVEQWPQKGVPANPRAWLVSTGRFKAIDAMRRGARFGTSLEDLDQQPSGPAFEPEEWDEQSVEDDRLRLIFTCCHPALPPDAQIALTLREVCGLTTEENRARIPDWRTHNCQTDRARQGENTRCAYPLRSAVAQRSSTAAGCRTPGHLPGIHGGLLGFVGRVADPRGSLWRSHPARTAVG